VSAGAADCPFCLARGTYEAEVDGDCEYRSCTECGSDGDYRLRAPDGPSCQLGVPESMQQHEPPSGGLVFLGTTIERRPP
jgi:hypothetical protein